MWHCLLAYPESLVISFITADCGNTRLKAISLFSIRYSCSKNRHTFGVRLCPNLSIPWKRLARSCAEISMQSNSSAAGECQSSVVVALLGITRKFGGIRYPERFRCGEHVANQLIRHMTQPVVVLWIPQWGNVHFWFAVGLRTPRSAQDLYYPIV